MAHPFAIARRAALKALGLGAVSVAAQAQDELAAPVPLFQHGIASGDPLSDRVIIWTRVTVYDQSESVPVLWQVAEDVTFEAIVASGDAVALPARDYTVKIDATGLKPGTRYYYRFLCRGQTSPLGAMKTLPVGDVDAFTVASCSCANYPFGFFNAYREMAADPDIDLVIHLGNYIYEYGNNRAFVPEDVPLSRVAPPDREASTLSDYRLRYATYREDPDLQAVHAAHPFLVIWDDHESADDAWTGGANNHQPDKEGPWEERRAAALQAWEEWMPTRADVRRPWRSFDFGNLARIVLLDTRLWGRDKQLSYESDFSPRTIAMDVTDAQNPKPLMTPNARATRAATQIERLAVPFDLRQNPPRPLLDLDVIRSFDPASAPPYLAYLPDVGGFREKLEDPSRTLLGTEQEAWLGPQLDGSKKRGQTWQIIAQQILMARINIPLETRAYAPKVKGFFKGRVRRWGELASYGLPLSMDTWSGYPAARERLYGQARQYARNVVVLTGDSHHSWVNQLADKRGPVGWEVATGAIASPGFEQYMPAPPDQVASAMKRASPDVQYMDAEHRGFTTVRFTQTQAEVTLHHVSTVSSRSYTMLPPIKFIIEAGEAPAAATLQPLA
ncbi:MAG: alkaline phosphatase D family protein [Pseudomonadota bacterium]